MSQKYCSRVHGRQCMAMHKKAFLQIRAMWIQMGKDSQTCVHVANLFAFGGAPRREADSQPISQLVRQVVSQTVSRASRQADRNTQFGLFSVADSASSNGEDRYCQKQATVKY